MLNTINYGCYSNKTIDNLISQAESIQDGQRGREFWHQADHDAHGERGHRAAGEPGAADVLQLERVQQKGYVGGRLPPNIGGPDLTNVWLKNG